MSFPSVNRLAVPSPDPVDVLVAGSEGNTMVVVASRASSPLSVLTEPQDSVMVSPTGSPLSSAPKDSGPLFVNLDAEGIPGLPAGVADDYQPMIEGDTPGILGRLLAVYQSLGGELDWQVVNGVYQLRNITSNNHQVAALGQCLGVTAPSGGECARCIRGAGVFASCRVASFVDGASKGVVLSLGACMCCHFAGVSHKCSLRSAYPAWVLAALRVHAPDFPGQVPSPVVPQAVPSPITPPRAAPPRATRSSSGRSSRFVGRLSRRLVPPPSPSPLASVGDGGTEDEEGSGVSSGVGVGRYSSVLTRDLFDAGAGARLAVELRLRRELAQLQLNVQLVQQDLSGLESLRRREEVASALPGGEIDPCWADFVADV
ncbi:hypothetical protein PDIG_76570 [Penicillium digitatum PHI26]|uniref:Uncharacterized protein n=3 Tax=Penicillium digitatum TaxID=36651 RepID=K9FB41_PEND2|nr:hypothetical protein PDIP_42700 [Penicillium digitatum Pd1]EKV06645.1 hypothetical protein PDIG_76570 [Penicillium digitatum PHI26]EKV14761.1 hypothetical protein PDIP_42700 [Penicillium digitatum Pd1]KAG0152677.1 hypothetical protein PDIDSM_2482 [Penicillium digitatum]